LHRGGVECDRLRPFHCRANAGGLQLLLKKGRSNVGGNGNAGGGADREMLFRAGRAGRIGARTDDGANPSVNKLVGKMNFAVRKRRAPSIIIVSLVDILTILLIFFVVSTTFKKDQPEVQINLPESKTATKAPAELEHAIVTVDEADAVKLDGQSIEMDELERAVRNLSPTQKASLALQADKKASFGTIVKVMDALKLAGVRNLPA